MAVYKKVAVYAGLSLVLALVFQGTTARPKAGESKQGPSYEVKRQVAFANGVLSNTTAEEGRKDDKLEVLSEEGDNHKGNSTSDDAYGDSDTNIGNTTVACSGVNEFCDRVVCCHGLTCTYNEIVKYKLCK